MENFEVKECFAQALNKYRDENSINGKRMTQAQLAQKLGYERDRVQHWSNPKTQDLPMLKDLVKIAELLGMTTDQMLTGVKPKYVDIHRQTGLSGTTIERLKHRNNAETAYIKTFIELLLRSDNMCRLSDALFKGAAIKSSQAEDPEDPSENDEFMLSGIKWFLIQELNGIIEEAMEKMVELGKIASENGSYYVSDRLNNGGYTTAAMDFKGVVLPHKPEETSYKP